MATPLRIVHIDDNKDDAYLIGLHLRSLQPDLHFVSNREEFEKALTDIRPDVILSDFRMPVFDGDDAFEVAKSLLPAAPFILVTGELGEEFVIERLRNGVADYVLKDNLKRLVPVIERAVKETSERLTWKRVADKFNMVIDTTVEGVWMIDRHGTILTANNQMAAMLGLASAKELNGRFAFNYIPPKDLPAIQAAYERQIHGEALRFESHLRRNDGTLRRVLVSTTSERGPSGEVETILSMFTDVTELQQMKAAQGEVKSRMEYFTKRSPIGVLFFDLGGRIQYCSESAAGLLGIPSASLAGKMASDAGLSAEVATQWTAAVATVFSFGTPVDLQSEIVIEGKLRTLSVHLNREPQTDGAEPQVVASIIDITATVSTVEKVQSTADSLGTIIGAISDGLFAINRNWDITFINTRAANQAGRAPAELIGKNLWSMYPELRGSVLEKEYSKVMSDGVSREFEFHGIVHDVDYHVCAYPTTEGIVVYWRDVTERKKAVEALRTSEERHRILFESMTEAFTLMELLSDGDDGVGRLRILDANPALETQTGLKRADVIGKNLTEILPDFDPQLLEILANVARTGSPVHGERFSKNLDSWYGIYAFCPHPGKVAIVFTNVTARKNAESALRRSEERLSLAQHAGGVGVFDWDMETSSMVWTPELEDIFGLPRGSFEKKYEGWASRVHPDDLPGIETMFQEWMDSSRSMAEWEYRVLRDPEDGSKSQVKPVVKEERWVAARGQIIRDAEGRALRMIGTIIDITDQKLADKKIHQLNIELEERVSNRTARLETTVKELETFTTALSHDLKAPLRAIHGFAALALETPGGESDEELRQYLHMVIQNAIGATKLMDELLEFMRLGRDELALQSVDMVQLVGSVVQQLKATEPADRRLEIMVADLPPMVCNETLVRQVWTNLIANALKFSRAMPVARIEISASLRKDHYTFSVCDNGVGFDHAEAKKLFGVFQRLHPQEDFEGSGIGLASVKRIIERHGGKVWADGDLGKGACFYFTLPIRSVSEPAAAPPEQIGTLVLN